jgi:hypothetical protein
MLSMLVVTAITVSLENPQIPLIGLKNKLDLLYHLHTVIGYFCLVKIDPLPNMMYMQHFLCKWYEICVCCNFLHFCITCTWTSINTLLSNFIEFMYTC